MKYVVLVRSKTVVNTDPRRRCYNGCHAKSETLWSDWEEVCRYSTFVDAMDSAQTFAKLNGDREYKVLALDREEELCQTQ